MKYRFFIILFIIGLSCHVQAMEDDNDYNNIRCRCVDSLEKKIQEKIYERQELDKKLKERPWGLFKSCYEQLKELKEVEGCCEFGLQSGKNREELFLEESRERYVKLLRSVKPCLET